MIELFFCFFYVLSISFLDNLPRMPLRRCVPVTSAESWRRGSVLLPVRRPERGDQEVGLSADVRVFYAVKTLSSSEFNLNFSLKTVTSNTALSFQNTPHLHHRHHHRQRDPGWIRSQQQTLMLTTL